MNNETEQIFSSTGALGVSYRQYDRLYVNGTRVSDNFHEVQRNFGRLMGFSNRRSDRIGRVIFRGVATDALVDNIVENDMRQQLEVALPLAEIAHPDGWLIYLASNQRGREQIVPIETMITETDDVREPVTLPLERVKALAQTGCTFTSNIQEDQVAQVHALWGNTFGWQLHEVQNLARRLARAKEVAPDRRDVWFSAVQENTKIVSMAMAERLTIPSIHGPLDLVESTEWRTQDTHAGKGLMTGTLALLNAQVLADLAKGSHGLPLLYAECNFQSRSDRAGLGAGFRIPPREQKGHIVPQILIQNVAVEDGVLPRGRLRDFTFMYVPQRVIEEAYDPVQRDTMIHLLQR